VVPLNILKKMKTLMLSLKNSNNNIISKKKKINSRMPMVITKIRRTKRNASKTEALS
jgi:hypothetical protein